MTPNAQTTNNVTSICKTLLNHCIKLAGSQAELCRNLPAANSHISLVKTGKALMGPELFFRCLEYSGLDQSILELINVESK